MVCNVCCVDLSSCLGLESACELEDESGGEPEVHVPATPSDPPADEPLPQLQPPPHGDGSDDETLRAMVAADPEVDVAANAPPVDEPPPPPPPPPHAGAARPQSKAKAATKMTKVPTAKQQHRKGVADLREIGVTDRGVACSLLIVSGQHAARYLAKN